MNSNETVFVGLSGGVDSSVAALRLLKYGYRVVGVFIETWQPEFIECDQERERLDAMRVAATLDIPFLTHDAKAVYKESVAEYMIREYQEGRTPNPDVMCNTQVKFGSFLSYAKHKGADMIATGHHAQICAADGFLAVRRGADPAKDQSYFLWMLTETELRASRFPVGTSTKEELRREAAAADLPTANKPDSQGLCFLGEIDMRSFLSHYIEKETGSVVNEAGETIGNHEGVLFYTLGQRHGFTITKTETHTKPHYVVAKNIPENTLVVSTHRPILNEGQVRITETNQRTAWNGKRFQAQFRYRQKPFPVTVHTDSHHEALLDVEGTVERPSPGQSCVLYDNDICVGGGIIV